MTRQESHRLKRKLEYLKGYYAALLWIQSDEPYDDEIEQKLDEYHDKIEDLEKQLSKHELRS